MRVSASIVQHAGCDLTFGGPMLGSYAAAQWKGTAQSAWIVSYPTLRTVPGKRASGYIFLLRNYPSQSSYKLVSI